MKALKLGVMSKMKANSQRFPCIVIGHDNHKKKKKKEQPSQFEISIMSSFLSQSYCVLDVLSHELEVALFAQTWCTKTYSTCLYLALSMNR